MKIFHLERIDCRGFGMQDALMVRAESSAQARELGAGSTDYVGGSRTEDWLNPQRTSCKEVTVEGKPEVIMESWVE